MDIFRVFDALNDVDQLEVGVKAVLKAGGVAEGTLCYSGDSELCLRMCTCVFIYLADGHLQC